MANESGIDVIEISLYNMEMPAEKIFFFAEFEMIFLDF